MDTVKRELALPFPFRLDARNLLCSAVLAVVGFVVLYPLFLLLLNSFQIVRPTVHPNQELTYGFENWVAALTEPGMLKALLNTTKLTFLLQLISFPVAIVIVWLLARTDIPAKNWFEFLFWIAFFAPSLPITLGWVLLLDPDFGLLNQALKHLLSLDKGFLNIYSFWGLVWVHLATKSIVVKVILLTPLIRNLDASFEEASRVSGAGLLKTISRIVVPVMAPAIMIVLILSIIYSLESFEIEQVLGPPFNFFVYSTMIYRLLEIQPAQYGAATALAVVILVATAPLIFLQHQISKSRRYTTIQGQYKARLFSLRGWRWPAFALVLGLGLLFTFLPILFLVLATLMRLFGFFDLPNTWTLEHWERVLSDPIFLHSLSNTLLLGAGAVLVAVIWYPVIAYIAVRTRYKARQILDFLSWLPIAIPGIILGLGFLWLFLGTAVFRPFYGTIFILILAAAISSMTLGVQLMKSNLLQLGQDLEEASWVAGGAWFYTFRRIVFPILAPVVVTVGLMAFIAATRNIAGISLLVTNQNRPLAMLQLDYMVDGRYEAAAVVGVIVMLLTSGVALIARSFGLKVGIRS